MWILVLVTLLLAAQCSLTAFAPAPAGKAWLLWPFDANARPILPGIGGLPQQGGSMVTPLLAGVAGLAALLGAAGLFGLVLPIAWWQSVVLVAGAAGLLLAALYVRYLGIRAILPLLACVVLLVGVIVLHWSPAVLRGI